MDEEMSRRLKDNIQHLREIAYNLEAGKLSTQELLDVTQEFREEIAELIMGLALQNEKILRTLEKQD